MSYMTIIRDLANKADENPKGHMDDILFLHTYLLLDASKDGYAFSRGTARITMTSTEKHIKGAGTEHIDSLILENSRFKIVVSTHDKNGVLIDSESGFNLHVEVLKKDKYWYNWIVSTQRWGDEIDVIINDLDALLITLRMTLLDEWKELIALVNAAMDGSTVYELSDKYGNPYVPNYLGTFAYCTEKGEMDLTKMSDVERRVFDAAKKDWWHGKYLDSWALLAAKQTVIKYGEKACLEADDKELVEMFDHTIHTDFTWRYGLKCGVEDGRRLSMTKL